MAPAANEDEKGLLRDPCQVNVHLIEVRQLKGTSFLLDGITRALPNPRCKVQFSAGTVKRMQATKTFASYSPAEVALRYLADPTPPSEAVREDFDAAIGFIDVSGFTALSEKLAKEAGDAGAELLNLCANPPPLLRSRSPPG